MVTNPVRKILLGNITLAGRYIGFANHQLQRLKSLDKTYKYKLSKWFTLPEVNIHITTFLGQDTITIWGNLIDTYNLLLLPIAIGWDIGSTLDGNNQSIYTPYFYHILEKDGAITISRAEELPITYGIEGLNLTIQTSEQIRNPDTGVISLGSTIHANVANSFTPYEEELGALDWRRSLYDLPDQNLWWGKTTVGSESSGYATYVEGSNYAQYNPNSDLVEKAGARHSFFLQDDKVIARWLSIGRVRYSSYVEYPLNYTYDTGQIVNMRGRLEQANGLRDGLFEWSVDYASVDAEGVDGPWVIGTTKYRDVQTDEWAWTYHVPIVALAPEIMLRREVSSTGDSSNAPCGDQRLVEALYIGDALLDTATYNTATSYTIGPIDATKTDIPSGDSAQLSVRGDGTTCPTDAIGWTMEVTPASDAGFWTLDRHGDEATLYGNTYAGRTDSCSKCVVTATCGDCGSVVQTFTTGGAYVENVEDMGCTYYPCSWNVNCIPPDSYVWGGWCPFYAVDGSKGTGTDYDITLYACYYSSCTGGLWGATGCASTLCYSTGDSSCATYPPNYARWDIMIAQIRHQVWTCP